jgi:pimeloyl-ACP methyl ester carboxylesterase
MAWATVIPVPPGTDPAAEPTRSCLTSDGVHLAVYDFGGTGTDLLLVHATGFCAGVLLPLARALGDRFHCWGVDLRGHGRSGRPVDGDFDWSGFATDVLATVDGLGLDRPVAFGHSCGGASLLLSEQRRPGTFGSLYLFEPVIVPDQPVPFRLEENPLSTGARRRRESFPSTEDAFVNFSSKPPFCLLDPAVLLRYVEDGFEAVPTDAGGNGETIRLRCRREDEAEIYVCGFANGAFEHLSEVRCPTTFGYGTTTDSFGREAMAANAALVPGAAVEAFDGLGHFGPLERPDTVAERVGRFLELPDDTSPS